MRLLWQTINAVGIHPKRGSKPTYEEAGRVFGKAKLDHGPAVAGDFMLGSRGPTYG